MSSIISIANIMFSLSDSRSSYLSVIYVVLISSGE